jgi:hypothetical protein
MKSPVVARARPGSNVVTSFGYLWEPGARERNPIISRLKTATMRPRSSGERAATWASLPSIPCSSSVYEAISRRRWSRVVDRALATARSPAVPLPLSSAPFVPATASWWAQSTTVSGSRAPSGRRSASTLSKRCPWRSTGWRVVV